MPKGQGANSQKYHVHRLHIVNCTRTLTFENFCQALETKLAAIKEERERLAELREEVADKKREEAMVQDEIARDFRCKVDTEKQLERSRKDLHEMRAKLAPLLKEQLAAEEEVCVLLALLEAANLATLSLHSCSELGAAWAGGLRELLPAAQSSE